VQGDGASAWRVKMHGSPPGLAASPISHDWAAAKAKIRQFIVVSPQRPRPPDLKPSPWQMNDAQWVWQAVSRASNDFGGNGRFILTGFSYGAGGALKFAAVQQSQQGKPDVSRWSAYWAVDPNPNDAPLPVADTRVLLHHGGHFQGIAAWKAATLNPPWQEVNTLQAAAAPQPWWTAANSRRAVRPFNGLEHAPTCTAAYLDPDAYDWLVA
jgi:hypothetical protein